MDGGGAAGPRICPHCGQHGKGEFHIQSCRIGSAAWPRATGEFQWKDERGAWNAYSADVQSQLRVATQADSVSEIVTIGRNDYRIDLRALRQQNIATEVARSVRRVDAASQRAYAQAEAVRLPSVCKAKPRVLSH
jgi:hypothetical protein